MTEGDHFSAEGIKFHKENHRFSAEKSFDYNQITENIFLGTNMCCIVGYAAELKEKGVLADISLERERIDNPEGIDYFLWLPTPDGSAPTQEKIVLGVKALDFFKAAGVKVYVHCQNGHGRAPTIVIAHLVSQGRSLEEALALVKKKRPSIHPNEEQLAAIKKFSQNLGD